MMSPSMRLSRLLLAASAWLLAASCSQTPTVLPSRDFDRPTDMVFTCMGVFGGQPSGRPMDYCHPVGFFDTPADLTVAQPARRTFAFVPDSNSGEITVIDADVWKPYDLDPRIGGYNRLPIGALPLQISASDDGCRLITANQGSCDFTLIDPAALVFPAAAPSGVLPPAPSSILQSIVPTTSTGRLHAAPQEVRFLPQNTAAMFDMPDTNLCTATQTPAGLPGPNSTPGLTSWKALATFPTCDLIAVIDLPSGVILDSAYVRADASGQGVTLVPAGTSPTCPFDCDFPAGAAADGGVPVSDGGTTSGVPASFLGPSSIAIVPPEVANGYLIKAYVSLANAPFVVGVNVTTDAQLAIPAPPAAASIALNGGAIGSNRIRLSVNPYQLQQPYGQAAGSSSLTRTKDLTTDQTLGAFVTSATDPKSDREYLYVIARDGSLRVVQVNQSGQPERECDTNIDPLNPPPGFSPTDACVPVLPNANAHNRPFVLGPGIRLGGTVPIDVMAADIEVSVPPVNLPPNLQMMVPAPVLEDTVSGAYAWVVASNGFVYLVNLDPTPRAISVIPAPSPPGAIVLNGVNCVNIANPDTNLYPQLPGSTCVEEPTPTPNTLRNHNILTFTLALDSNTGPPRLNLPPPIPPTGPRIESVWTQGTSANAAALTSDYIQTQVVFPDPTGVTPQTWSAIWQGGLLASPRVSGKVSSGVPAADPLALTLEDLGADFCGVGTEKGDLVTLTGCLADNQCGLGKVCLLGQDAIEAAGGLTITGICITPTDAALLKSSCAQLLSTVRRYDVVEPPHSTVLALRPHMDEVLRARLQPAAPAAPPPATDGGAGGSGGAAAGTGGSGGTSPCVNQEDPTTANFSEADFNDGQGRRCVMACANVGETTECRSGRICVAFPVHDALNAGKVTSAGAQIPDGQFCADAPPAQEIDGCYQQVTSYMINAGRSFVVTGSRLGAPSVEVADNTGLCVPNPGFPPFNPNIVSRISMDAPDCTGLPPDVATLDSRCNPQFPGMFCANPKGVAFPTQTSDELLQILQSTPTPPNSACLFVAGPNESDPTNVFNVQHTRALFRNTQIAFMITNFETAPISPVNLTFDVHGGFAPQVVLSPATVEVSMPARILLGPVDTLVGTAGQPLPLNTPTEVPYIFVVDQRRLGRSQGGGPTRGQILRINPIGFQPTDSTVKNQPIFEDVTTSNSLFPLQ
jgi:hypothetical protein